MAGEQTLQDLIMKSALVRTKNPRTEGNWSIASAMGKNFGTLYYNNKVAIYDEASGIIEIRMTMGTATETQYQGYHVVRIALYGIQGKVYNSILELYREKFGKLDMRKKSSKDKITGVEKKLNSGLSDSIEVEGQGSLPGFIIPVATLGSSSFGRTFENSGKFFYSENRITYDTLVRVSCSCSDYYYTFSQFNYDSGVHLGAKPAPIIRKRDLQRKSNRGRRPDPIRNIYKVPGLCKHLMMFTMLLISGRVLNPIGSNVFDLIQDARRVVMQNNDNFTFGKKLASEAEMTRLAKTIDTDLKQARKARTGSIKVGDTPGLKEYRSMKAKENIAKGLNPRTDSGLAGYENAAGKLWGNERRNSLRQAYNKGRYGK